MVADPVGGAWLRHVPIPLEVAREAIEALNAKGFGLNCYVDDELYVAEVTPEARRYADFQDLELHPVGDLLDWLDEAADEARRRRRSGGARRPRGADEGAVRGSPLHLEVAAVLPRVRELPA